MLFFILSLVLPSAGQSALWTKSQVNAYSHRHFVELEHFLDEEGQTYLARQMRLQREDLVGCNALNRGGGGVSALVKCIRFINREKDLGFKLSGTDGLIGDINKICGKIIGTDGVLEAVIASGIFKKPLKIWAPCVEGAWQQVYLAAYAGFDGDPIGVLALVRRAKAVLGLESSWKHRTLQYVERSSLAGYGKIRL